jgi:hypothetical protein
VATSIETDKLDALYKRLKPAGVTMTALLAKAVGNALVKHPVLFASEQHGPPASPLRGRTPGRDGGRVWTAFAVPVSRQRLAGATCARPTRLMALCFSRCEDAAS